MDGKWLYELDVFLPLSWMSPLPIGRLSGLKGPTGIYLSGERISFDCNIIPAVKEIWPKKFQPRSILWSGFQTGRIPNLSFVPQGLNRVHARSLPRRNITEDDADRGRKREGQGD